MILILEKPVTSGWVSATSGPLLAGPRGERGKVEANHIDTETRQRRAKIGLGFRVILGMVPILS